MIRIKVGDQSTFSIRYTLDRNFTLYPGVFDLSRMRNPNAWLIIF